MQAVWPDTAVEESNLAYHVFAIRKALGESADADGYIETVPKHGYRFVAPVVRVEGNGRGAPVRPTSVFEALEPWEDTDRPAAARTNADTARRDQTMAALEGLAAESVAGRAAQTSAPRPSRPRRWAWAAVIPVMVAATYGGWEAVHSLDRPPPLRAIPLTSLPGVVRYPSFSPDGNYVVFSWNGPKQDNPDVYVQQIGAGSPLQLTTDVGNDFGPVWSPDGRSIAFLRQPPDTRLLECPRSRESA